MHLTNTKQFMDRIFGEALPDSSEDPPHAEPQTESEITSRDAGCWAWIARPVAMVIRLVQILFWLCIPVILAWSSPCLWWSDVADMYTSCSHACSNHQEAPAMNRASCSNIVNQSQVFKAGLPVYDTIIPSHLHDQDLLDHYLFGTKDSDEILEKCGAILNSNKSAYAAKMLENQYNFAAFESLTRRHYRLSVCDVTGSLLSGSLIVLWLAVEATKKRKLASLDKYKRTFLMQNFPNTEQAETFAEQVRYLYALMYGKDHSEEQQIVRVLDEYVATLKNVGKQQGKQSRERQIKEQMGKLKPTQSTIEDYNVILLALFLALIHVLMPALVRLITDVSDHSAKDRFLEALLTKHTAFWSEIIANMISGLFGYLVLFLGLISSAVEYRKKQCQLLAFKCMWKFPDEDPQETIFLDGYVKMSRRHVELKEEQEELENGNGEKAQFQGWHFDGCMKTCQSQGEIRQCNGVKRPLLNIPESYHGDFSQREWCELAGEDIPKKLSEWFYVRRFIQLNAIDERISIELYSSLGIMVLVYKLGMVYSNWLASHELLQAVNCESLYDVLVILYFLLKSLTLTLAFNNEFEQHHYQLEVLKEHIVRSYAEQWAHSHSKAEDEKKLAPDEEVSKESDEHRDKLTTYIDALREGMAKKDHPATIFGLQVNRRFITTLSVSAIASLSPMVVATLQVLKESGDS
eukprot:TRINITY_DN47527_c0_g1_i1.p1 TRINITY_DN47527_c0_g1~~TRINITY_DN47527_c0_g1_i1.p1  ORF type:complete len:784 (+),score=155.13 TRINITY_DN47527_c0_g1_i1:284-2353(+)